MPHVTLQTVRLEFLCPADIDPSTILERLHAFARECAEDSSDLQDIQDDLGLDDSDGTRTIEFWIDDLNLEIEASCSVETPTDVPPTIREFTAHPV